VADLREAVQMVIDEDGVPEDIRTLGRFETGLWFL